MQFCSEAQEAHGIKLFQTVPADYLLTLLNRWYMLSLAGYNFYLYTHSADMRMSINGLSGIVRNAMLQELLNRGMIYLFFNGRPHQG
jgi:hypothetical protein